MCQKYTEKLLNWMIYIQTELVAFWLAIMEFKLLIKKRITSGK